MNEIDTIKCPACGHNGFVTEHVFVKVKPRLMNGFKRFEDCVRRACGKCGAWVRADSEFNLIVIKEAQT